MFKSEFSNFSFRISTAIENVGNSISIPAEFHNSALSWPTALGYRNLSGSIGIQQNVIRTMKVVHKS